MNEALVTFENLSVRYARAPVLEDISCSLRKGQVTALIGPNGSGKTTLLKTVLGLVPYEGKVGLNIPREDIGYVPQRLDLDRSLPVTVSDFVAGMTSHRPLPFGIGKGKARVTQVLERAGALHLQHATLGGLSGGELQRVMLALALEPVPQLLLLDEPASGMDVNAEAMLYDIIKGLVKEFGMGVVLVSHDLSVVSDITDHVLCINRTLVCEGGPESIVTDSTIADVFGHGHGVYTHHHHGDEGHSHD